MRLSYLFFPIGVCACVSDPAVTDGGAGADGGTPQDGGAMMDQSVADQGAPPMTDVNGVVVDEYANPIVNAAVRIGAVTATTDAMGKFTLKADPTYRIEIVYATTLTTTNKRVLIVDGLTTRTPILQTLAATAQTAQTFTLTITGAGATVPAGQKIYTWTEPTSKTSDTGRLILAGQSTTQAYAPSWYGASPIAGKHNALLMTIATMGTFPTGFTSYGSSNTYSLAANGVASATIGLNTNVTNSPVSGTIAFNGNAPSSLGITYRSGGVSGPSFYDFATQATSFALPMPNLFAWRAVVRSVATTPSGGNAYVWKVGVQPGTMGLSLSHAADLVPMAPNDGATMVDPSTAFRWPARANTSFVLSAFCGTGFSPDVWVDVLTSSTSTSIPNTTSLGSGLPPNGACKWYVGAFGATKTDDLVGPAGWQRLVTTAFADADGSLVQSKLRGFTPK